ncbi:unnamed protein product [Dracunculus medinensis]|uniref:MFS domain-containing protein n=1 Tax=Dracunculus medinensis TaxID=318479 RepID=A0A158Q661_DRAME|nr:unnamed protein product [Dracunculus medinensis]
MDFDSFLAEVGDFGIYQTVLFFLICLPASLPSAFSAFNQPFVVGEPVHNCKFPTNREDLKPIAVYIDFIGNLKDDLSCWQYNETEVDLLKNLSIEDFKEARKELKLIPCQYGWDYDNSTYINTLVTEFNLVCDQKNLIDLTGTAFYIGSFIGNIVFGHVADKFGRRVSFFIILLTLVVFGSANAFAPNIESFIALRFLTGLPFPALFQIPFIISIEFMGESGRVFCGLMIDAFFGLAMVLLGLLAMFVRRWRLLIFLCNAPFVILFSYYLFLPESPRWLASVGRFSEAKTVLSKIAKANGKKDVDVHELILQMERNRYSIGDTKEHTLYDLFRTPNLRKKTLIVTYIWFVNAAVYNCMTLNISNLPVNDYVSFIINGAVELPAYFIIWPLLSLIGRRWSLASSMLLAGIACVSTMFAPPTTSNFNLIYKVNIAKLWNISNLFWLNLYAIPLS